MSTKSKLIIEKIINIILNILLVVFGIILLISIYTGVQTKLLGNKYTDFFGYSLFEVQTGSMADAINSGDWIIVQLTKKLVLNDIITFEEDGEYITHRLIEAYNNIYITKGDANNTKDEPIYQKQAIGKVVKVLPNFGVLRKTLFNPSVLIALFMTLVLFSFAIKTPKDNDKQGLVGKTYKYLKDRFGKTKAPVTPSIDTAKLEAEVAALEDVELEEEDFLPPPRQVEEEDDELDKTTLYRVIPVDISEIGDTFLDMAKKEAEIVEKPVANKNNKPSTPKETNKAKAEDEKLTKINLELLKNKKLNTRDKNIITTVMVTKEEEINELLNLFNERDKKIVGEPLTRKIFIHSYLDYKYYNNINGEKAITSIDRLIKSVAKQLIKDYRGKDAKYSEMVTEYAKIMQLIADLDQVKFEQPEITNNQDLYAAAITNNLSLESDRAIYLAKKVVKIHKNYQVVFEYFLKKLETNMFNLKLNRIARSKNMLGVELEHNISFNKLYSEYVIYKTYTEGIVAEDKVPVLLTLLLVQVLKDMTGATFNKQYILYLPSTLYDKGKKIEKLFGMISDPYAKQNSIILLSFNDLVNNLKLIKNKRLLGYRFAVALTGDDKIMKKDRASIALADYVFINKKDKQADGLISFVPDALLDNIIYEDMTEKIGDFGGEQ